MTIEEIYEVEIAELTKTLDEAWPQWCAETMHANADERGMMKQTLSVPIRAAIELIKRKAGND